MLHGLIGNPVLLFPSIWIFFRDPEFPLKRHVSVFLIPFCLVWLYTLSVRIVEEQQTNRKYFWTAFKMELCSSSGVCFSLNFSLRTLWNLWPSHVEMPSVSLLFLETEHMNIYKYKLWLMDRKFADAMSFFSACERISLWREQFISCFCLRDGAMHSLDKRKVHIMSFLPNIPSSSILLQHTLFLNL